MWEQLFLYRVYLAFALKHLEQGPALKQQVQYFIRATVHWQTAADGLGS